MGKKVDTGTLSDPVLEGLKRLRIGRGLTEGRLSEEGAVMSALGTGDPADGLETLQRAIEGLGDGERNDALRVDLGISLDRFLRRRPTERERDRLGERRDGYAEVIGRGAKTLSRWSDDTILELRSRLISDVFYGHIYVVGIVDGNRIGGISVVYEDLQDGSQPVRRRSQDFSNQSDHGSIPALIYAYPRDWKPTSLRMALHFLQPEDDLNVQAVVSDTLLELPFAQQSASVPVVDGLASCRFDPPRRDRVHTMWWSRESH